HVDHGKSTLADRLLEFTKTVSERELREQTLDTLDIERERGITIKAVCVQMQYIRDNGEQYTLHLIDTPGHADFSYEVSRALAACEGALLLVDATQGVQAQTLAHAYKAVAQGLEIIPVINKIDLPSADCEDTRRQIEEVLGLDASDAILASAKTGTGTKEILESIVQKVPHPKGNPDSPLRALIFDAKYDTYRGVVVYLRIVDGSLQKGQKILFMSTGVKYEVDEVGIFTPSMRPQNTLSTGEVGYMICNIKNIKDTKIGDTVTDAIHPAEQPLPGYEHVKPVVFCGMYPAVSQDYDELRDALDKLALNDASFEYKPDSSDALGLGFRLGFLGLLHMEIIQERLEREFGLNLVMTMPNVAYKVLKTDGEEIIVQKASQMPQPSEIEVIEEPY
ncbi:MAG: translation elongation factor 4, partial [Candidatus Hydrogenedens sp.]